METDSWKRPLVYGLALALGIRITFSLLHLIVWAFLSAQRMQELVYEAAASPELPTLATDAGQVLLGAWRRWDAMHYLNLAVNGYRITDPGATVFGPGAPLLFALGNQLVPGPPDLAAAIIQVLLLTLVFALTWQICTSYYGERSLGPYAVLITALLPTAYVFWAPMSESLFLALTLAFFYACSRNHYFLGALLGFLAALTRSQGVILVLVALALLYEQRDHALPWKQQVWSAARRGWPVAVIPFGYLLFVAYRASIGLPPLGEVYANQSYVFFVDPISGILLTLRWILQNPTSLLTNIDIIAMVVYAVLIVLMLRSPRHRRPSLLTYIFATLLVVFSKMNYMYGTDILYYTQSFARYALVLWPVHIFVADCVRGFQPRWQKVTLAAMASLALIFGTLNFIRWAPP
ncbi:MAG: hypothetical protein JNL34_03250 [Anaerolineae bacterium]|nr:hypothetical protein [Anaerolineae bacterium]